MITTAASQFDSRIWCKVSSPSIPGNQTSSNTHPYKRREIAFKQSSPLATASVSKPSSRTTALSVSPIPRSSSTIRIDSDIKPAEGVSRSCTEYQSGKPFLYLHRRLVVGHLHC